MFNHERPHEGLNNETPGSIYQPSAVMFPRTLIEFIYPTSFLTRRVNNSGDISWHKDRVTSVSYTHLDVYKRQSSSIQATASTGQAGQYQRMGRRCLS